MAAGAPFEVARQLERALTGETLTGLEEGALLRRFVAQRDALAFEMIVARHGPMVLSVCRRLLQSDPHTAEDAFQATFLVLVKRARSIRDPGRLGPWLYGVAHRVAKRARADILRRQARERGSTSMDQHPSAPNPSDIDGATLHEELNRLPRAYRDVVVVCDLERHTHEQAAQRLGWPIGTVKGRLSRAREQLRGRLERRGVTLGAAALVASLEREAAAAVSAALLESTVRSAASLVSNSSTAGAGVVSASVLTLTEGVTQAMTLSKLGLAASLVLVAGTVTSAGMLAAQFGPRSNEAFAKTATSQEKNTSNAPRPAMSEDEKAHADARAAPEQERISNEAIADARAGLEKARLEVLQRNYKAWAERLVDDIPQWNAGTIRSTRDASTAIMRETSQKPHEAAEAHLRRMSDIDEAVTAKLTSTWASMDKSNAQHAGAMTIGGAYVTYVIGYGDTKLPELGVIVAEAKLWAAQAAAGQQMTGLDEPLSVGGTSSTERSTPRKPLDARTSAILKVLDAPLPIKFGGDVAVGEFRELAMGEFLKFLREASKSQELPSGLPFYVDPAGLLEAEKTLDSAVGIGMEFEDAPLKTALRLALRQLNLAFMVKDGLVIITYVDSVAFTRSENNLGDPPVPGYGRIPATGQAKADSEANALTDSAKSAQSPAELPFLPSPTGGGFR